MIRRAVLRILTPVVAAATAGCATIHRGAPSVEGDWSLISATLAGRAMPPEAFRGPLRLSRGTYTFQNDTGEYVMRADARPAAMDVIGRRGPNAGRTLPAIYRLDGDTLTICYDLSGTARPTEFRSDAGSTLFLARYVRGAR